MSKSVKQLPEELFTTAEICKRFKVSRQAIFQWRKQGMPVAWQSGVIIRYDLAEVLNWLDKRKHNRR